MSSTILPATVAVVASDWLRPRLQAGRGPTGEVVGAGRRAAYVRVDADGGDGHWMLAIEAHDAVGLPCGMRVPAPHADLVGALVVGTPVSILDGAVDIGGGTPTRLEVARWQRAVPPVVAPPRDVLSARLTTLVGALADVGSPGRDNRMAPQAAATSAGLRAGQHLSAPDVHWWPANLEPPPDRLAQGAHALVSLAHAAGGSDVSTTNAVVAGVVHHLVGWGPGSTPSGDDLLAGFVATLHRLDVSRPIATVVDDLTAAILARAPGHTTDLSATLLASAVDGAMALPAAALVQAVTAGDTTADRMQVALARLTAIGHTSGHDLALGILTALHVAATTATPTPRAHFTSSSPTSSPPTSSFPTSRSA